MVDITLFEDQDQTVQRLRESYRTGRRAPLLAAPTGFGKTVVFSYLARNHLQKGGRVLILVHREELLEQVSETLERFRVLHSCIAPGSGQDSLLRCDVGSVFSVVRRLHKLVPPTLVIVDEAHHCTGQTTFGKVLTYFASAARLGVTATPFRLSGEGLNDHFDAIVLGPTVQQLIDAGRLSRFRVFCPSTPDLSGVHKRTGDFVTRELEQVINRPGLTGDVVSHYRRIADGRRAVAFCVSVQHAKDVAQLFSQAGYPSASIDGAMPKEWRRDVIRDFRNGRLRVLTSCDLISEGFDVPAIEVGISLRPTMSLGLWLQQFGRCLRTFEGKSEAIMLDHAGNALRHGLPTDAREYTLEGLRSGRQADRVASVRLCQKCFAASSAQARACSNCGVPFPIKQRALSQREGELEELTPEELERRRKRQQQGAAQSYEVLVDLGRRRGYASPERWAQHVWEAKEMKKARTVKI